MLADVVERMDKDHIRIRLATGVGEAAECRDDRVVVVAEVAPRQDRGAVDRHGFHDDHPGAAERAFAVVADVAVTGKAVLGHVGGVRTERDSARERLVAKAERLEEVREAVRHVHTSGVGSGGWFAGVPLGPRWLRPRRPPPTPHGAAASPASR